VVTSQLSAKLFFRFMMNLFVDHIDVSDVSDVSESQASAEQKLTTKKQNYRKVNHVFKKN
jgi:hypothetical protein